MKKQALFLFALIILSCTKDKKLSIQNGHLKDSVVFYSNKINNQNSNIEKINLNKKLYRFVKQSQNTTQKRENLDLVVNNCYNTDDWKTYYESSTLLLNDSKVSKDSVFIAKSLRYKGNYFYNNKILDSAFYFYIKSEKIFFNINDKESYALVLLKKGIVQLEINDFSGADISVTKAYFILKNTTDHQRVYGALTTLGSISSELKEFERSINYYSMALEVVKKYNLVNQDQEANCLNNLGLVYSDKNYEKAINYFNKALADKKIKNRNPELYSLIIDNLAYVKLKSKNFNQLPNLFFESIKIRDSLNDKYPKVLIYNHLSEYFLNIKDSSNASVYSKKALDIAYKSKIPSYIIISLKQAAIVDQKNASKLSYEYIKLSDSLQLVERNSKNLFARIQLETDEIIQQKDILEEKNRNILNYFLGAIIIGGFLFFIRIQRSRSRELVLKQSQQQANEEIYRLIISHQNQLEEGRDLEKKRLSKELHDGVLGRLFGLRLNLDGLNNSDDQSAKQQRLDYLNELQLIEQDLRDISHELNRENLVLINNFVAIINNLLEQQAKINPAKIKTIIADDIDWEIVSNTSKINLYRILQEALQNINKHAEAKNVLVHFRKDKKGNLLFNIEDDGKGYDMNSKKSKGIGMKNIVSRTQQCQGIIDIKSEIGKGSKIIITFPLENKTIKV